MAANIGIKKAKNEGLFWSVLALTCSHCFVAMNLLRILSYSNVWIACAAVSSFMVYSSADDRVGLLGMLMFFSALFLYNFQRLFLLPYPKNSRSERHVWMQANRKGLVVLCVLSFLFCVNAVWILTMPELVFGLSLLLVGVFYSYFPWKKPLRKFGWLKTLVVSMVWTIAVFFFEDFTSSDFKLIPLLRFVLLVYLLTLLFEYRDRKIDDEQTLPKILSARTFGLLLLFLNLILIGLDVITEHYYLIGIDVLVLPVLLYFNFKNKGDLFYSFVVDGYLVLSAVFYALK